MEPRQIIPGVEWVGAVDWQRELFDALIPLPDRTSYNAYLVKGSKATALIDAVDPLQLDVLLERLKDVQQIDYIISLHSEQDHSGGIPVLLEKYPQAKLIASPKGKENLITHLHIPAEMIHAAEEGEVLALGNKTLRFYLIPWVHWPDTMAAFLEEDKLLFTTDFFGAHLATASLFASTDEHRAYAAAKRYYAEIMMPLRKLVIKNLEKLEALQPRMIAPSHGPVYDRPELILDAYRNWTSGPLRNTVVIPFISMHGSTLKIVTYFSESLADRGVASELFDLTTADIGKIAEAVVDAPTLVVGSPTVLGGPHPSVVSAVFLVNMLRPRLKYYSVIGSYGWGGHTANILAEMMTNLKAEAIPPVLIKGLPTELDFAAIDELAATIAKKHSQL